MTEEASSETLVGEAAAEAAALVGDEELVTAVSLFNIDAVQRIPDTFYHNYHDLIAAAGGVDVEDLTRPTNVPVL